MLDWNDPSTTLLESSNHPEAMASNTATKLTEAVLIAVRRNGYAGTSLQDLLRDTGVSSSSMYHFFPNGKEELVASAIRTSGLKAAQQIRQVLEEHGPLEGIALIFDAAASEMTKNDFALGCPIGVPATEAAAESPAIREAVSEVFTAWTDAYAQPLIDEGEDPDTAQSFGRFVVAVYEGSVTLARATRTLAPYTDAMTVVRHRLSP